MKKSSDKARDPSWLESENDESFREEASPLVADDAEKESYNSLLGGDGTDDVEDPEPLSLAAQGQKIKPHAPRDNACLWCFHLLEGATIIAALFLFTTQIIPIFYVRPRDWPRRIGILPLMLKFYVASFCIMFAMVELDWPVPIIRSSQLLQGYISRGFLYSFLGLICVEESTSERIKEIVNKNGDALHLSWASIFMQISSWCFLAVGVIYMLLGVCCLRNVRNNLKENERNARRKYREEMKAWSEIYA